MVPEEVSARFCRTFALLIFRSGFVEALLTPRAVFLNLGALGLAPPRPAILTAPVTCFGIFASFQPAQKVMCVLLIFTALH